jgi:hypothetical protein
MKNSKPKPDKREQVRKRWFKKEIDEALCDAYLGPCPACGGSVCGALDEPKCRDCGWSNDNQFLERGAA